MQEGREKEGRRPRDLRGEARREGHLVRELAARELAEAIDRGHGVNVDRVDVVDVMMHAPDDGQKLRHHGEEQADVVKLADDRAARRVRVSGTVHVSSTKIGAGLAVGSQPRAPRRVGSHPRDRVTRERQDGRSLPDARREDPQGEPRIVG